MNRLKSTPRATLCIIILCTVMFVPVHLLDLTGSTAENAILFGAYYRPFVLAGEWWRLLSMGLIHGSFMHLAVNMFSLYNLGSVLEKTYGTVRYLIILVLSTLCGSLLTLACSTNAVTVGLSGGLYGLMASWFVLLGVRGAFKDPYMRSSVFRILLINLMINFMPNIGVLAHLGGFVGGLLLGIALSPDLAASSLKRNSMISFIMLLILLGARIQYRPASIHEMYLGTDIKVLNMYSRYGLSAHAHRMAVRLDALYDINYLKNMF